MQDRLPRHPGRVKIIPEDGTAEFYAVIEMADSAMNPGTPLNKATLLADSTAKKLGLTGDATVNDALSALAEGAGGSSLPEGGNTGDVLVKTANGAEWKALSTWTGGSF